MGRMTEQPIVVFGATGTVGGRVAAALRSAGKTVRAASRRADVRFDWTDRSTWAPTLDGARALFLMAPDDQLVEPDLVAQAAASGVEHVVLLSSEGIEVMGDERLMDAERAVRSSGLDWTIVRPTWFDQNFDEGFLREAVLSGTVTLPLRDSRYAFVDASDIAAVVATSLTAPGHTGRTHVVTGPELLTFGAAVRTIADASGRPVTYAGEPEDHLAAAAARGVAPEVAQAGLAAFDALCRHPELSQATDTVRVVAGREPISFAAYAARAAAAGAWTT